MKYFETVRVHSVKAREVFEEETQVSLQRKQAVQKVLEEKMQALVELAKTVDPALPDWSIAELDAQARQLSGMLADEGSPGRDLFFAVCSGPYRIQFRICTCGQCGQCGTESFVREYAAKILALKDATFPNLSEDIRAKAGQMDSIALAMHVVNAGIWVCIRQPNDRLSLSVLHSALPKWVLHAT